MNITESGTVDINGFNLKYIIEGEGSTALVIGSAIYYQRIFSPEIKKHLRFVFIDHKGFVSPPVGEFQDSIFELDVILEDVEVMRRYLKLEKFTVIGHSGHAFMALEYAKKYPEHVDRVVMIGVTPSYSAAVHQAADRFFAEDASPERKARFEKNMSKLPGRIAADPDKRFISFCLAAGPKSWYDYNYDATAHWEGVVTNMQMIDYVWGTVFKDIDITIGSENINCPIFLALGKYDYLTGPTYLWEDIKKYFRDMTIKIFEKSAHCPQFEQPELFDQELLKWMNK